MNLNNLYASNKIEPLFFTFENTKTGLKPGFKPFKKKKKSLNKLFHLQNFKPNPFFLMKTNFGFPVKYSASALPKALFHIKCIFNLNEFKFYDCINFYMANKLPLSTEIQYPTSSYEFLPIRINFFFRIKKSMRTLRSHTLRFFVKSPKTERRATLFLESLSSVSAMGYF